MNAAGFLIMLCCWGVHCLLRRCAPSYRALPKCVHMVMLWLVIPLGGVVALLLCWQIAFTLWSPYAHYTPPAASAPVATADEAAARIAELRRQVQGQAERAAGR